MEEKQRKVENVFSDYKTDSNIKQAEVSEMNWQKKVNSLKINIQANEYIEIKELWFFEKFLIERFKFSNIEMVINYDENVEIKDVKSEWENLICYMTHKYPLMKPMLLLKSDVTIEENTIQVAMHIKGADFLKTRKLDIELERVIKNLFNKQYKVNIYEQISEEQEKQLNEISERAERHVKELAMEKCAFTLTELAEKDSCKRVKAQMQNNQNMGEVNIAEIANIGEEKHVKAKVSNGHREEEFHLDEESPLILGKSAEIKENFVNITEITADEGKVAIDGEILNGEIESRELKSGRVLLTFNVYDGTSTMTCKTFYKP